jgi:tripartite-type tricarboxylate transporter receptor subunit TctC
MYRMLRHLVIALLGLPLFASSAAATDAYPTRPVRVIVPYAAGGTVDVLMRQIGQKLTESWKQPIIIENKPGGGTIIGVEAGARAAGDGYTITAVANSFAINPSFKKSLPYDTVKDFVPVIRLASTPLIMAVHPSTPAKTVKEYVALAKQSPGKLAYGSIGPGSISHLLGEAFELSAGVDLNHIPYKGQAPATNDLLAGHIGLNFGNTPDLMPHIRNGSLRALAITSAQRSPLNPDLPTMVEQGYPDIVAESWFGLLVPTGTPPEIVTKLNTDIGRVLNDPEVADKLNAQGLIRSPNTAPEFGNALRGEIERYAKILKEANIQPE